MYNEKRPVGVLARCVALCVGLVASNGVYVMERLGNEIEFCPRVPFHKLSSEIVAEVSNRVECRMPKGYDRLDQLSNEGDCVVRSHALLMDETFNEMRDKLHVYIGKTPLRGVDPASSNMFLVENGFMVFSPHKTNDASPNAAELVSSGALDNGSYQLSLSPTEDLIPTGNGRGNGHSVFVKNGVVYDESMNWINARVEWISVHKSQALELLSELSKIGVHVYNFYLNEDSYELYYEDPTAWIDWNGSAFEIRSGAVETDNHLERRKREIFDYKSFMKSPFVKRKYRDYVHRGNRHDVKEMLEDEYEIRQAAPERTCAEQTVMF